MSDASATPSDADVTREAETIAADGRRVRERVRTLVLETIRDRRLGLSQLGEITQEILTGAVAGLDRLVPAERESPLRQVFDGLDDGLSAAANATRLALQEARGRGEKLAENELKEAVHDLETLEQMFFNAVSSVASASSREASGQLGDLLTHARRVGTGIKPAVRGALAAATSHPVTLAGEAATTGARAARQTAGFLMHAMSGLLDAAAEIVAGGEHEPGAKEPPPS